MHPKIFHDSKVRPQIEFCSQIGGPKIQGSTVIKLSVLNVEFKLND